MTLAAGIGESAAPDLPVARRLGRPWPGALVSWLQAAPLAIVLLCMFVAPLVFVVVVSFFDYDRLEIFPAFMFDNYVDIFTSEITVRLYLKTLEYAALVEAITVVIGFLVAYFLTFHVRTMHWRVGLLVACTIPFFTSNMIRMISWIPFLGREGILNSSVLATHLVKQPLDFLLFSDFAVEPWQNAVQIFDDGNLGAKAAPDRAEFEADDARAHNKKCLRHRFERKRAGRGNDGFFVDLDVRKPRGIRARGDDNILGLKPLG